eukprot:TRINITY_DN5177_c0_g1_i1.p2 TRINITY_DN5177_c0_g1~~TRINITY_DN5177_c0_g1_i1.p2  ORF type:complete len:107 (-),score=31.35 TRINITY_DN5177_c0_g1_i1:7-327(-)
MLSDGFKLTLDKLFPPPESETIDESAFPVDGYKDNQNLWKLLNKKVNICLLYTSDAADEEDSVNLGGRRVIQKKKKNEEVEQEYVDKIRQMMKKAQQRGKQKREPT